MDLHRILASICRQRILLELSKVKELNIMELVRRTKCPYTEVNRNLHLLGALLVQKRVGRMRFVRLNLKNGDAIILVKALKVLEKEAPPFPKRLTTQIDSFPSTETTAEEYPMTPACGGC